jgi:hypothetical protein
MEMEKNFDIQRMSADLKIPVFMIRKNLGLLIKDCNATSIEEAKKAVDFAPGGSEEQHVALCKWEELSEKEIIRADKEMIKKLLPIIPKGGWAECLAYQRLIEFSETRSELEEIYPFIAKKEHLLNFFIQKIANFYVVQ